MALITQTLRGPDTESNCEEEWSGEYFTAHLLTDVGKRRSQNEDAFILCAPEEQDVLDSKGYLIAVADGMGGANMGELASKMALTVIAEKYYAPSFDSIPNCLRDAVVAANNQVFAEATGNPDYFGMGTTVSVVIVHGDHVYIAQVGDSRVYLTNGFGTIQQLTEDHSIVAEQVRDNQLTEEEARNHALKNLITRAVGTKADVAVDLFWAPLREGYGIVICSDGLSNVVTDEQIMESMQHHSLKGAARKLVGYALEAGGPDNITVVALRMTRKPPKSCLQDGADRVLIEGNSLFGKIKRLFV